MKDDKVYLQYILECITRLEEYTAIGRSAFLNQHLYQDAILRNIQTLAESTQRLSNNIKATQPEIPGTDIGAFRNIVVHNYLGIDLDTIWDITQEEIPALKIAVMAMLSR